MPRGHEPRVSVFLALQVKTEKGKTTVGKQPTYSAFAFRIYLRLLKATW